ncbi:unnamed protein product [Periconia digitata]|uniref:Dipeptidyl-peptidase V n=1 Tax=Periconia digitata TaxID=1303443 RepID=A0A9W4XWS1_9PLEO|nr:unnamed protein product [Periconia digitata]
MARFYATAAALLATGAHAITPSEMLSAPRRGVASPNPSGDLAVFSYSQYSFEEESNAHAWHLLDLKTGKISDTGINASEVSEIVWVPGSETGIIYINGTNEDAPGGVTLWMGDIKSPSSSKMVASLDAPYSGLKVANTSSGDLHFLVNAKAYENGTAYNPETAVTPKSTARFYENIYVRHWDTWVDKQRYAVFAGSLSAKSNYALASDGMRNLLKGIDFTTTRPESPVQPFGDLGDYDISPSGGIYAFISKAPQLNKANFTASYVYTGLFNGTDAAKAINGPDSEAAKAGHQGASGSPRFSPDSETLVFTQQDQDYYESDRVQLYAVDFAEAEGDAVSVTNWRALTPNFDRWVSTPHWAPDGKSVFITAEDRALVRVFNIPLESSADYQPTSLSPNTSYVSDFAVLPDSTLLVSGNCIWSSRDYYTLSSSGETGELFSSTKVDPELAGLGPHTFSEIYFDSVLPGYDEQIHAVVIKPSNYTANTTYPLAYIVHGGPQGSNANSWSTRWNWQVWADQGYIVVGPNPTGSTGFGQKLTDGIQGEWGGYPYDEVVNGWQYVHDNLKDVNTDQGIMAGASYGGYMSNWIQGHDLGRKFKAIVTHDGISQTQAAYSTEELWFIRHDYDGSILEPSATYDKWNPFNHIANFSTPQFVIHNTLDYRLPESDGIGLFNVLQSKGVPSRFLNFPDENHWVLKQENSLVWHTEIFNWINHYSKGLPLDSEPIGQ